MSLTRLTDEQFERMDVCGEGVEDFGECPSCVAVGLCFISATWPDPVFELFRAERTAHAATMEREEALRARVEAATKPMPITAVELRCSCDGGECDDESEWLIYDAECGWIPVCQMHYEMHVAALAPEGGEE